MKIGNYEILQSLLYTREHEWVKLIGSSLALVGISDYAAKMLHEIVYVALPSVGSDVKKMEIIGSVESVKAVSDIYCPISGSVVKVNENLLTSPELINRSPYDEGWMIEITPSRIDADVGFLLKAEDYAEFVKDLVSSKT